MIITCNESVFMVKLKGKFPSCNYITRRLNILKKGKVYDNED